MFSSLTGADGSSRVSRVSTERPGWPGWGTPGGAFVPDRVEWLHAEMLKARVAHGYYSRHPAAGACP